MSTPTEYVQAIERYGYTPTEARFLYLVATHSGYFTQQQFFGFAGVNRGGMGTRLTVKAHNHGHIRTARLARHTLIYNLFARPFYEFIEKDNLRNRRRLSDELIRTRLLILDFVLAHPDHQYLETEHEKVRYFHEKLGLPLGLLPHRTYKGTKSQSETQRYFVDRFPIFRGHPEPGSHHSVPAFVYCDSAGNSLLGFVSHLENYQPFLRRLPAFEMVYAAPSGGKFHRAEVFFTRLFAPTPRVDIQHLCRYFTVRQLWESGQTSQLTRTDRESLRDGDQRYQGQLFDHAYREWAAKGLSPADISALVNSSPERQQMAFKTVLLPSPTTFWTTFPSTITGAEVEPSTETLIPPMVPLQVPLPVPHKHLKSKEQPDEHHQQCGRGKKHFVAGSDPIFGVSITPKSLRASGVAPGHSVFALRANFQAIPRPHSCQFLSDQTNGAHLHNPRFNQGEPMPLLKPPEPVITQRRYYVRIEEPLAQTMERYAEFLGTPSIDHVIAQALQFIFKRDAQFKSWLEQNPEPTPKPAQSKTISKRTAPDGGAQ